MVALVEIAKKKNIDLDTLKSQITASGGPVFSGTVAEANKFHDDKSLYTGVYAQGGPTNVDSIGNTVSFGQSPGGQAALEKLNLEEEKKEPAVVKPKAKQADFES